MKKTQGFTLVEIMIVVAIIGIIIAIAVPAFLRARENSRGRACQENLSKIDGSKEQYALEFKLSNGGTVTSDDLLNPPNTTTGAKQGYLKSWPKCPSGGTYSIAVIGDDPACSIGTTNSPFEPHVLQ
jgi:prepilin-type N-terminal cleavage/methylation domain-containing protein